MCEYCNHWENGEVIYQNNTYCDLSISHFGNRPVLIVKNLKKGCPQFSSCNAKSMNTNVSFLINYCPNCGKQLLI